MPKTIMRARKRGRCDGCGEYRAIGSCRIRVNRRWISGRLCDTCTDTTIEGTGGSR